MNVAFVERRASARVKVARRAEFRLGRRVPVRVVDISADGTLVACDEPVAPGTRARLLVSLGAERFDSSVEIVRASIGAGSQALIGARNIALNAENRAILERFLARTE